MRIKEQRLIDNWHRSFFSQKMISKKFVIDYDFWKETNAKSIYLCG